MARKTSSTNKKMCEAYPEWTQSRFESFVKSVLRAGSRKWPPKYKVLNEAKRGKQINQKSGRLAEHFECAECHHLFPGSDIVVDHIIPVVLTTGWDSWDNVINRLYCNSENLQAVCKECHKVKTKKENEERKAHNNNNKA